METRIDQETAFGPRPKLAPAGVERARVPHVYKRIAPIYDWWGELTESRARRECLEQAAIRDGEAVLEVAVGTGLAFEEIVRRNPGGRNEGVDVTPEMLAQAQAKLAARGATNFNLQVGDAYDLPFPDESFDALVNNYMFDLLPEADFARVLTEFRRVLRPGGRLVLINMAVGETLGNRIWDIVYWVSPALLGGCRGVALMPYVQAAGFEDARRVSFSQLTFPSELITARRTRA
ncbi:MAG: methyltransferase domain-containing protein [Candidatus Schekmanbacteria bacterium]|nr:methyltransferase domain-containing protein [Candidatus Schekmanbacteria bacterium]